MALDWVIQFELIAEQFYRETGYIAPGKDPGPCTASYDIARHEAWNKWVADGHAEAAERKVLEEPKEAEK